MFFEILIGALVLFVVVDLASRVYYGRKGMELLDRMPPFRVEPAEPQKQATPFEATTKDGLTLRGSIYHPEGEEPRGLVVFCPETIASHWSAVRYCQGLIDAGYIVVSFDFRNQGESDRLEKYDSLHWVTEYEVEDLKTVLDWVRDQAAFSDLPIGVFGVSRGGSVALMAASALRDITFIAADSSYTNDLLIAHYIHRWVRLIVPGWIVNMRGSMWHIYITLKAAFWAQQFRKGCRYLNSSDPFTKVRGKRVLLIAGMNDSYVPTTISQRIQNMLGTQCEDLWLVPRAAHNGARSRDPEQYDQRLTAFFDQMVEAPASAVETVVSPKEPLVRSQSLISN